MRRNRIRYNVSLTGTDTSAKSACASLQPTEVITESLLVITGTMGSGKSAVLGEASDLLSGRSIHHAAFDLDAVGLACLPADVDRGDWMYRNLRLLCENSASTGISRVLLARAVESRTELALCQTSVAAKTTVVCRLAASLEVAQHRIKLRETGIWQAQYVARVAKLDAILNQAGLEDFTVRSENRSVTDTANEMLVRAGWL
jgi:hypothetical protein